MSGEKIIKPTGIYGKIAQVLNMNLKASPEYQKKKAVIDLTDYITNNNPTDDEIREKIITRKQQLLNANSWKVVKHENFQKGLYANQSRVTIYNDAELMENFPEIGKALDIYAQEATTFDDDGNVVKIFSNDKKVKGILEDLFFNILNINGNAYHWVRNMIKYGDNFLKIDSLDGEGIVGVEQLRNLYYERHEYNAQGEKCATFFKSITSRAEFNITQIAHFRLLSDDRMLPYGTSILSKVRRIHKLLSLAEDSMLIYRMTRASERKLIKVYVGNIDDDDVDAYIEKVANSLKRTQYLDENGNIDLKMSVVGIDQDLVVPVRTMDSFNMIENLPAGQNIAQIEDINYLLNKLVVGLGIPKQFLGFQDAAGGGKNLSIMDVRFARMIQHIQRSFVQELNKIAIIHLYLLGYEDAIDSFKIGLNNPSVSYDLLKIELYKEKIDIFDRLTEYSESTGFAAYSFHKAKKLIFRDTDEEIREDLIQQRFERMVGNELKNTEKLIGYTGYFDDIDKIYANKPLPPYLAPKDSKQSDDESPEGGPDGGGSAFDSQGGGEEGGGVEGLADLGDNESGAEGGTFPESIRFSGDLLNENNDFNLKTKKLIKEISNLVDKKQ